MQFNVSLKSLVFLLLFKPLKKEQIKISIKFHFKKRKIYFELLVCPSFDELHCSPIVHVDHMEPIFQDLPIDFTKKVQQNHSQFCHFCHGGGIHFLQAWCLLRHLRGVYRSIVVRRECDATRAGW